MTFWIFCTHGQNVTKKKVIKQKMRYKKSAKQWLKMRDLHEDE